MEKQLTHLPGIILAVFLEYAILLAMFRFYRIYCSQRIMTFCCRIESQQSWTCYDKLFKFEDTYESLTPTMKFVLIGMRLQFLGYILIESVIGNYVFVGGYQWFYFSVWNNELLCIYYFLALLCSMIGLFSKPQPSSTRGSDVSDDSNEYTMHWNNNTMRLAKVTHILFEVCSGSAALVTVINFSFVNPEFTFWNVTTQFIPLMSLLVELSLSNMYIRADHYIYNISWLWLYLIFMWPLVALGTIPFWPYRFLAVDTTRCYLIYTALLLANVFFYFVLYGLSSLKYQFRHGEINIEHAFRRNFWRSSVDL